LILATYDVFTDRARELHLTGYRLLYRSANNNNNGVFAANLTSADFDAT
jgi:CRISPR/Cas system-associated endoribonuclease Cas2